MRGDMLLRWHSRPAFFRVRFHRDAKDVPMTSKQKCVVCGFNYDPKKGDRFTGVKPDTTFEQLPEEWRCPICKSGKTSFEPTEDDKK